MSATKPAPPAPARDPADTLCTQCGAELADDQEWCLECGGARTLIHRAPDWRVSAAVIAIVVAIVLGGFVVALIALTNNADRQPVPAATAAQASSSVTPPTTATPATPATRTTPSTSTSSTTATSGTGATTTPTRTAAAPPVLPAGVATWPAGLPGWTVVLASSHSQSVAFADAARVAGAGIQVGVLDSSQHPHLAPGYWVVFSGRYPSRPQAMAAATQLIGLGQATAHPRLVGRPGGG